MSDGDARDFLRGQKVAQGTADEAGWPYAIPLVYVYEGDERLYRHTGGHHSHFVRNVQHNPRICVEVGEIGANIEAALRVSFCAGVHERHRVWSGPHPRRSSQEELVLRSNSLKIWRVGWTFEPGYSLDRIVLYEQQMEIVTGKHTKAFITETDDDCVETREVPAWSRFHGRWPAGASILGVTHQSFDRFSAEPLCIAMWSVLLLWISYCGSSLLAWCV